MTGSTISPLDEVGGTPWDAIVLGAGPAGSLAAGELAKRGVRVLLVERASFPRDKVCGACLNGPALDVLESVGLHSLIESLGGVRLDALHLGLNGRTNRLKLPRGIAVSRSLLDTALADAAVASGASLLTETRATLPPISPHVQGSLRSVMLKRGNQVVTAAGQIVVVAAGLSASCLSTENSFRISKRKDARIGVGCRVDSFPGFYRSGTIFMAMSRTGYVGLTRIEDGRLNIAAAFDRRFLASQGTPADAAEMTIKEAGFPAIDALDVARWKGTPSLTRRTTPLATERVFVIGDSCGYVEPFTGEGMAWAFQSANLVLPLVLRGIEAWDNSLARDWEAIHAAEIGRRQRICRGIASLLRHPGLLRGVFGMVSRFPITANSIIRRVNERPRLAPMGRFP